MSESGNKTQDILNAYADGAMTERERIIKLLKELSFTIEKVEHTPELAYAIDRGIALIKGENK